MYYHMLTLLWSKNFYSILFYSIQYSEEFFFIGNFIKRNSKDNYFYNKHYTDNLEIFKEIHTMVLNPEFVSDCNIIINLIFLVWSNGIFLRFMPPYPISYNFPTLYENIAEQLNRYFIISDELCIAICFAPIYVISIFGLRSINKYIHSKYSLTLARSHRIIAFYGRSCWRYAINFNKIVIATQNTLSKNTELKTVLNLLQYIYVHI